MKRSIKLAVVAALALGSTSAFATNGDLMIGQGAKSRAMGGVGIAKGFGAESGLANPAMINSVKGIEIMVAATAFAPTVEFSSNAGANAFPPEQGGVYPNSANVGSQKSASDFSVIPEFAFGHKVNDSFAYGFSLTGTAGMGVDYSGLGGTPNDNGAFNLKTSLSILKVAVPIAYSIGGFTLGVEPVYQYGTLQINYLKANKDYNGQNSLFIPSDNPNSSSDGFGYEVGMAYEISGFSIGAVYKSEIEMEYKDNISTATKDFGFSQGAGLSSGDVLTQPAEIGLGLAYSISGNTLAFDYKNIQWGEATGYKDFGWENQDVFAVGYEYMAKSWAFRLGYNYGKSPIIEQDGSSMSADGGKGYDNAALNFFNVAGFPGIVEQHFTLGGGFKITEALGLDASVIYAPEVTNSFNTSGMTQGFVYQGALAQGFTPEQAGGAASQAKASSADVSHSQMSGTLALNYQF